MLATLTISGSGAVSTQTAWGRRTRAIRSATIACSRRSLSLRRSCSPRWSSTAGSELRRVDPARATVETLAPERRISSSGLAPTNAASGVPQQKQKQEGNCSRIAPKTAAGSWAAPADTSTSRASTTFDISPASIRPVAAATARSKSPGGGRWKSRPAPSGEGRALAAGRRAAPRAWPRDRRRGSSASSPGRTTALTVRKASSPLRQSESSGNTSEAGGSEDQVEEDPPSGSKAKPPTQTGPAPAGRPRGSSKIASAPRHPRATSRKRSGPRDVTS